MDSNGDLLENIQKLIRSEFENLRRETLSLYQADLAKISDSIQSLSDRIKKLEVYRNKNDSLNECTLEDFTV